MRVQLVLQPENEEIGRFEMDALPRVGDAVALQLGGGGKPTHRVSCVRWWFISLSNMNISEEAKSKGVVSVTIDIERTPQPEESNP
jgi:hypothetical protein